MRYEERIVDEVQSLNDIVDVVSNYLPLKRSGHTFKALCPFHQEKTPSFIVHPEKQIFHCFGCSVGGNVFSFVMKYENLTFPEALRNLAARVNYPLPEPTRRAPEEVSEAEALHEVYRLAHEYYSENLRHPEKGKAARDYLQARGFGEDLLKEMLLGYATPEWRGLFEFLARRGVKDTAIFRSGLIQRGREGHPYDLFRGRLMFPIHNLQGKVIAFGGRALGEETPKYLNSPESPIFRKRRELFGLHLAKRFLSGEESRVLIVEGYFDFLKVYSSGLKNVVATLGTALTEEHVRILKRFVQEAVVIYDGDKAGEAASLRGLEVFLEGEMSVKVVTLPLGKDPDTFIGAEGPEALKQLIDESLDFFDFKWKLLTRRYRPSDSAGLLKISNEFLETLSKVKSPILLDRYLKRLAQLLGIGENSLRSKLAEMLQKNRAREAKSPAPLLRSSSNAAFPEELTLISLLLDEPELWEKADVPLAAEDFRHPGVQQVFQMLQENLEASSNYQVLFNRVEDESLKALVSGYAMKDLTAQEKEKAFLDCVRKIKRRRVDERLEKLRLAISNAEGSGKGMQVSKLLEEYRSLLTKRS